MALYIAVLDDNAADRKQLERLLDREHTKRQASGQTIYIDSFGNSEALLQTPYRYDLFLIDVENDPEKDSLKVADKITDLGIEALIVIMNKTEDESGFASTDQGFDRNPGQDNERYIRVKKTLYQKDISALTDEALKKASEKTPLIEIRCKDGTVFTPYTCFAYALNRDRQYQTEVHLSDGRVLICTENMAQFSSFLLGYDCMFPCGRNFVNLSHVTSLSPGKLTLSDGTVLRFPLRDYPRAKKRLQSMLP
ncbi:MAG: hypothetical protein K5886_07250 [Lachnospiraceae bacterium]|nr:hypothetical protein [Lachnospiraceae bacterium]